MTFTDIGKRAYVIAHGWLFSPQNTHHGHYEYWQCPGDTGRDSLGTAFRRLVYRNVGSGI